MSNTVKVSLLVFFSLVIGLVLGFFGAKGVQLKNGPLPKTLTETTAGQSKLFNSQTATIQGKILKVSGNIITVQNKSGLTGDVEVAKNVLISKIGTPSSPASPSTDMKSIELNGGVFISLQLIDGVYKAILIQYLPELPKTTNSSSSSVIKKNKL